LIRPWGPAGTDRPPHQSAGQNVGIKQVADEIWLVSFMEYAPGFFDDETCRLGSAENPFGAKVLPMSPV
jgi:putative transposase